MFIEKNEKDRTQTVHIYDEISMTLTSALIKELCDFNDDNLVLILNSPGGDLFAALGLISRILELKKQGVKIRTVIRGRADSAASIIAVVGDERVVDKYGMSLIHEAIFGDDEEEDSVELTPLEDLIKEGSDEADISLSSKKKLTPEEENEVKTIKESYRQIYLDYTKITPEELEEVMKVEKYYNPKWLLEKGFVDEIV